MEIYECRYRKYLFRRYLSLVKCSNCILLTNCIFSALSEFMMLIKVLLHLEVLDKMSAIRNKCVITKIFDHRQWYGYKPELLWIYLYRNKFIYDQRELYLEQHFSFYKTSIFSIGNAKEISMLLYFWLKIYRLLEQNIKICFVILKLVQYKTLIFTTTLIYVEKYADQIIFLDRSISFVDII